MPQKLSVKQRILDKLAASLRPLAVHEFGFYGASQVSIASRLRELARHGLVKGIYREDKNFKEWMLVGETSSEVEAKTDFKEELVVAQ